MAAQMCERLSCLPEPGGWFDQSPSTVSNLMDAFAALDEKQKLDQKKQERDASARSAGSIAHRPSV